MTKEKRKENLKSWLAHHSADKVGGKVYDGMGITTHIDTRVFDILIEIQTVLGGTVTIKF